ncbi:hypothetical protein ABEB36_013140 [Hypothenemus hampei]|uniref:Ubiquitin thioesterase OTU n=1 Tax=Hypothenemus hampei TaxID=57062 RepID=A0ABD1EBF5_HYPHA
MHTKGKKSDSQVAGPLNALEIGQCNNNWRHNQQAVLQQIDVPADNSCLFWAATLAYLIPVKNVNFLFQQRYKTLFGNQEDIQRIHHAQSLVQNYNPFVERTTNDNIFMELPIDTFRKRVADHIENNKSRFESFIGSDSNYLKNIRDSDTWGGEPEIKAISEILKANITVYSTTTTSYNHGNAQIWLFHVNFLGVGEARNHYKYGLEQSIIDHYHKKIREHNLKPLKKFHGSSDLNYLANHFNNNFENNQVSLESQIVETIAKIEWYESKVMFRVTSVNKIIGPKLLGQCRAKLEKSKNSGKLLAIIIDLGNWHWVTLVIHYKNSQFYGYYVDCQEQKLPDTIKNAWSQTNNGNVKDIVDCTIKRRKKIRKCDSGMFAFKDAESIIKKLHKGKRINVKKIQNQLKQNYNDNACLERDKENFSNKLKQKDKMENKIKVCSEILQELKHIKKFSYENINIFLLFLEAIALEDSPQLGKDYLDKFKDEIIGSENAALAKTIRDRLFMHSEYNRVIEKKKLHKEMKKLFNNISCENFFQKLKNYMSQVSNEFERNDNNQLDALEDYLKTQSEIEDIHKNKSISTVSNEDDIRKKLMKLFRTCIIKLQIKSNAAHEDEITFILIENIIPNLIKIYPEMQDKSNTKSQNKLGTKGFKKMRIFRNNFFHNLNVHGKFHIQRNFILREGVRELLDYFFKYSMSQKVYEKFKNPSNLEQEIKHLLFNTKKDFKKYFQQDGNLELPILKLDNKEGRGSKPELSHFVKYLKLMSVIDNQSVANERRAKCKKNKYKVTCRKLKSIDLKRIYENSVKLVKSLKKNGGNKLIKDLQTEYAIWIPKYYLKKMSAYYMKDDNFPRQFKEIFYNDICILISFKENYKLSTQKVIKIYDRFARREKISSLLNGLKLSSEAKLSIEEQFCSLRSIKNRFLDLSSYFNVRNVKKKKIDVVVDTVKFTRNLFEIFDDHVLYPFLSASEEEIFSDEIFLDYLLNEEINITSNFLTELLQIKYMTPYVVKLVLENKLTPTSEEFSVIIRNLLEKDIYGEYLKELRENSKTYNVYQEIGNQRNKDNIQNIYNLFKDPKCITPIFGVLNNDAREILAQRTVALMKSKKGCHEDALKIFKSLKEELEMTFNDTEPDKLYLSLLFSSDIAYTNHLIGKYEDSYKGYKALYDNIMEQFKINSDSQLSCEIYNEIILKSEKYHNILVFNSKFLNILKIRNDMAYQLVLLANKKVKFLPPKRSQNYKTKYIEILIYYQDALKFYKEVYEIQQTNTTPGPDIVKTMCYIASVHEKLAALQSTSLENEEMLNQALNYYNKSYEKCEITLQINNKGLRKTYQANSQNVNNTLQALRGIARLNSRLGRLKQSRNPNEALKHYNKSLRMYEEVLNIEKRTLDEEHKYVLYTMNDIAHTNNNLARLKSKNKREALQHYEEAIKIYEHILKIQIRLGEEDCKTKRTKENLRNTTDWKNRLIRKPTDPISWRC